MPSIPPKFNTFFQGCTLTHFRIMSTKIRKRQPKSGKDNKALQRCSVAVTKTLLPNLQESSILYYIYINIYIINNIGIFPVGGKGIL